MNVLLMAKGTGGDIYPFLSLGKELKQRGHEVTLLTHCCFAQTVAAAGISFAAIDTQDGSSERVFHDSVVTNTKDLLATTQRNIETDLAAETELIEQNCTHNTILVAHENLQLTVQTAADKLQLPAVLVFLSPSGLVNLPFLAEQYDMLSQTINRIRARIGLATTSDWRAWIAQANLADDFLHRFQIRFRNRIFQASLANKFAGVHIDGNQGFGMVDHDVTAGFQPHFVLQRFFELAFNSEFFENRIIMSV